MKKILTAMLLAVTAVCLPAQVITTNSYTGSSALIPDGNPVGVMQQFNVSGLSGTVTNLQVALDITGGFNGDLYAYLVSPQGQMAVLLNRVGLDGSNPFGYSDAGFNITLDGLTVNNIHSYGISYSVNVSGQVTGTWGADGRNIDPQSLGSVFDAANISGNLGLLQNTDPNGTWTLFVADLGAGGGTANLSKVVFSIITVPEPKTWVLFGGGLALFGLLRRRNLPW